MKRANTLGAAVLILAGACGEPEEEAVDIAPIGEPTSTAVIAAAAPPEPLHGGTVLLAGEQPIEIVADEEGTFDAYYLGEPPEAPQDARITIRVPDADGQTRPVLLTWNPGEARYTGRLRGARPAPGPIELTLVLGGETLRASAPTFVFVAPTAAAPVLVEPPSAPRAVVEAPAPPPPPSVVVEAPSRPGVVVHAPEPPRPSVVVHAPSPPRPNVVVHAPPPPRPRVVVEAPAPPRVVVRPPAPPPPPRVVVRRPEPPRARVEVRTPGPPHGRVVVRGGRDEHRGRGRGRGRGRE